MIYGHPVRPRLSLSTFGCQTNFRTQLQQLLLSSWHTIHNPRARVGSSSTIRTIHAAQHSLLSWNVWKRRRSTWLIPLFFFQARKWNWRRKWWRMITTSRFSIFGFQNLSDFVYSVFLYELSISEDRGLENRLFPHTDLVLYDHKTKLLQIIRTISRPQLSLSGCARKSSPFTFLAGANLNK